MSDPDNTPSDGVWSFTRPPRAVSLLDAGRISLDPMWWAKPLQPNPFPYLRLWSFRRPRSVQ